jgi:hypothetical protein
VRVIEHVQPASVTFWAEALRKHLEQAGTRWIDGGPIAAGSYADVALPSGDQDWEYLVVALPDRDRMILVEAAGEIGAVTGRRDAILAAARTVNGAATAASPAAAPAAPRTEGAAATAR